MDAERAQRPLRLIADTVTISHRLGVQIWLRGGWAMDLFLDHVTRDHGDIDRDAWIDDAPAIAPDLRADGYLVITGRPPDQQLDLVKDGLEASLAWPIAARTARSQ